MKMCPFSALSAVHGMILCLSLLTLYFCSRDKVHHGLGGITGPQINRTLIQYYMRKKTRRYIRKTFGICILMSSGRLADPGDSSSSHRRACTFLWFGAHGSLHVSPRNFPHFSSTSIPHIPSPYHFLIIFPLMRPPHFMGKASVWMFACEFTLAAPRFLLLLYW